MVQSLTEELENSRKRLKKMLTAKVQEPGMSDAAIERRLNYIIGEEGTIGGRGTLHRAGAQY